MRINILLVLGISYALGVVMQIIYPGWWMLGLFWFAYPDFHGVIDCGKANIDYWLSRAMMIQLMGILWFSMYKLIQKVRS